MGKLLRSAVRDGLVPYFGFLKLFLTALMKLPSYDGAVWRGVSEDLVDDYPEGATVVWWGISIFEDDQFLSKKKKRTLFNIESPHWGKLIQKYSSFYAEAEVAIACGMVCKVMTIIKPAANLAVVHLRQDVKASREMIDFDWDHAMETPEVAPAHQKVVLEMKTVGDGAASERKYVIKTTGEFATADYILEQGYPKTDYETVKVAADRCRGELRDAQSKAEAREEE